MKLTLRNFRGTKARTVEWGTHLVLSGPHGAGKTTILDAIMCALYGCVPRIGKDSKALARLIGPHGEDAEVVYTSAKGAEVRRRIVRTEAGAKVETTVRSGGQAKTGKAAEAFLTEHSPAPYMVDMRLLQSMQPKDRRAALATLVPGGTVDAILRMQDATGLALDKESTPEAILDSLRQSTSLLESKRREAERLLETMMAAMDPEAEALAGKLQEMQAERDRLLATIAEQKAYIRQIEQAAQAFASASERIQKLTMQRSDWLRSSEQLPSILDALETAAAEVAELSAAQDMADQSTEAEQLADDVGRLSGLAESIKAFSVALKASGNTQCPTCRASVEANEETLVRLRSEWVATTTQLEDKKARLEAIRAQQQAARESQYARAKALKEAEVKVRMLESDAEGCRQDAALAEEASAEIAKLQALTPPVTVQDFGAGIAKAQERADFLGVQIAKGQQAEAARKALESASPAQYDEAIKAAKEVATKAAKAYADWQQEVLSGVAGELGPHIRAMGIEADAGVRVDGKDVVFGLLSDGAWVPIEEVSGAEWLVLCLAMQAALVGDDSRACIFELSEGGLVLDAILSWASKQKFAPLAVATWKPPAVVPDNTVHVEVAK